MLMLKVISLYMCLLLNTKAVPLKTNDDVQGSPVRPIEEIFQELDGYYQEASVSFNHAYVQNGVGKPIPGELDNSQNNTSTEDFPDSVNPIEELTRSRRQISEQNVRPIEEIFGELDNYQNDTETEVLPESYYTQSSDYFLIKMSDNSVIRPIEEIFEELDSYQTTTEPVLDENLRKVLVKRSVDNETVVRPIEEIFEELDEYQNATETETSTEDNYRTTTDSFLIEHLQKIVIKRNTIRETNVRPIEEIFEELDGYQNATETELTTENNYETTTDSFLIEHLQKFLFKRSADGEAVVRPIEEIFEELDGYQNATETESTTENDNYQTTTDIILIEYLQNIFVKSRADGETVIRPIEEIFEELDSYQNATETETTTEDNYETTTDSFFIEHLQKTIDKRSTDGETIVRPIEEIFEELDEYQNATETELTTEDNYQTTTDSIITEYLQKIIAKRSADTETIVRPIEEIFEELDGYQNDEETELTTEDENYQTTTDPIPTEYLLRSSVVRPIEDIFGELDGYQNPAQNDSSTENYTIDTNLKQNKSETRNIKPIEDLFQKLDNYQNDTNANNTVSQQRKMDTNSVVTPIEDIFLDLDDYQNDAITIEPIDAENEHNVTEILELDLMVSETNETLIRNTDPFLRTNSIRPGMVITNYAVEIDPNVAGGTFSGRVIAQAVITDSTSIEEPIMFQVSGLTIASVVFAIGGGSTFRPAIFWIEDDEILMIESEVASLYTFIIEYEGQLNENGNGLYYGSYDDNTYLAMNLNPIYARSVFPCMDEPTQESTISFTFMNINYNNIVTNSQLQASENNQFQFTPMLGPPHRWGMVAHNFVNVNNLITGGRLFIRSGLSSQEAQSINIINAVLSRMEDWTMRPYAELHQGQNEGLDIFAMPDITKEWNALSSVAVWEPYILLAQSHASTQRKTVMVETAKAISTQWFGYVIFPENWRYQWINTGLATHSAFETLRDTNAIETDNTVIDINAVFVAEMIQESLLRDGYSNALPLEPAGDLFNEDVIRDHVNGLLKFKAPVIMYMLKNVLGQTNADPEVDFLQAAARALLNVRALQPHTSLNFYDAVNSDWIGSPNALIGDIEEFLEPWVTASNYPVVNVQLRTAGVILTQERFSFSNTVQITYPIPITYTTSVNPNFEDTAPQNVLDGNVIIDLFLDEEDWFLANIQGQGYYRVNYDFELWERIIMALEDPESRAVIHPLNRATLVDDALNLARAGRLDYDVAFRVVLTMEHETDYSVWKAYLRNMDFIKKRLEMMVDDDEDLDPDIYERMIRRTVAAVENELGFYPDPLIIEDAMTSITRGLVMEHACAANYQPCIAAAIDWFYDPNSNEPSVNPGIPHDIRPAVYCTMMREGDATARDALWDRFDVESSHYERLVIVKALACSADQDFLLSTLQDTAANGGRFGVEERAQFFKALIDSGFENTDLALRFIRLNTNAIRNMYGGAERLEEFIYLMAQNVGDSDLTDSFDIWINSINSDLDDSLEAATRAVEQARENLLWNDVHLQNVYEWIDENDGNTYFVSFVLLVASLVVHVFNH